MFRFSLGEGLWSVSNGKPRITFQCPIEQLICLYRGMVEIIHLVMKMRVKDGCSLTRQLLYATWARPGIWYCYQPLDAIRRYLGVQIAIYFAWLGFYTSMLIPAAVVGVLVFIYGLATFMSDTPTNEVFMQTTVFLIRQSPFCISHLMCGVFAIRVYQATMVLWIRLPQNIDWLPVPIVIAALFSPKRYL